LTGVVRGGFCCVVLISPLIQLHRWVLFYPYRGTAMKVVHAYRLK
jgi:hypothetical protein